jgi:hypothetical protein
MTSVCEAVGCDSTAVQVVTLIRPEWMVAQHDWINERESECDLCARHADDWGGQTCATVERQ